MRASKIFGYAMFSIIVIIVGVGIAIAFKPSEGRNVESVIIHGQEYHLIYGQPVNVKRDSLQTLLLEISLENQLRLKNSKWNKP